MAISRRQFLQGTAAGILATGTGCLSGAEPSDDLIIDTHQHLWDLSWQKLSWLKGAPEILRQNYTNREYREATAGLNIRTVYMEVDVVEEQLSEEAAHVVSLSKSGQHPTMAAVVGGRPANPDFGSYVKKLQESPEIKGIRQVLHGGTPQGYCLQKEFVSGIELLGRANLSFDLCLRPAELADGAELARRCPEARFVVDHCGNADPKAFSPGLADSMKPGHEADEWKRGMEALASQKNTICKISGIVARAPAGWKSEHLAPIVNFCLEAFGPGRVVFGSDWPVCLLGAPLLDWVQALREIVAERPVAEQNQLWRQNAITFYGLAVPS